MSALTGCTYARLAAAPTVRSAKFVGSRAPLTLCGTAARQASFEAPRVRVRHSSVYRTFSYLYAPSKTVWLLGTAHISDVSEREVRLIAENAKPDALFVELCEGRMERMRGTGEEPQTVLEALSGIFTGSGPAGDRVMKAALQAQQAMLSSVFGLQPGGEFHAALEIAEQHGLPITCGDRDVNETVSRLRQALRSDWASMLLSQKGEALPDVLGPDPSQAVERLRERSTIRRLRETLEQRAPNVMQALLHERDELMAERLLACPGERVLAVVGAAHMDGIEERWTERAGE